MTWFQDQGYEMHAIGNDSLGGKQLLEEMGVICHDIDFERSPFSKKSVYALKQLKELFASHYFEVIHVHTPTAAFLTRYAAKSARQGKVVYTAHGFHFFKGASKKNWLAFYPAEKLAAKWTDALIVMNQEDFISGQKLGFKKNENLFFVNGVGVEITAQLLTTHEKQSLREQLGISEQSVVMSCVAELNHNKNHQFLLKNWKRLKQECPQLELLIIGVGDIEQELKSYVTTEQLAGIHFLGFRQDVPTLLQVSDIVTLLSHREGLPKSIMEAMEAGLPCVVTNTRGLRDLIRSNDNGFVVNHGDNEALITAVAQLAQSEQLREQMGQRAKQLVEPFLLREVLQAYVTIYKKMLK